MSLPAKSLPPVAYLRECFDYDPDTGELRWRVRPLTHFPDARMMKSWNTRFAGFARQRAGELGYLTVGLLGGVFKVHRVVWMLQYGVDPGSNVQIDHINGDKTDNHIANLRLATHAENMQNSRGWAPTKRKGAYKLNNRPGWQARISVGGKNKYLGYFRTEAEAHAAYCAAADRLHGEFANHG
jgi:hypothetical protein